jgi:SM-20-related protein
MTLAAVVDASITRTCEAVATENRAVIPDFLPEPLVVALAETARRRDAAGEFRAARIGRGMHRVERGDIRGDRTLWLDDQAHDPAERALAQVLERLRVALNETTFLGLIAFEGHYALYPPGAFYRRHRDRFRDDDTRVLSCVLYLNEAWTAADGGTLRIYLPSHQSSDVLPVGGTLVCFLADRFEHEVLPATRERLSIAGWFRRRGR